MNPMNAGKTAVGAGLTAMLSIMATVAMIAISPQASSAFPPYHLSDADTADPWWLEWRAGFLRLTRDVGENTWAPGANLRLNLGLPGQMEFVSEFEYAPGDGKYSDAAAGLKWAAGGERASFGVEAQALLPNPGVSGIGVEAVFMMTVRWDDTQAHFNAGGLYSERGKNVERGWEGGAIVEKKTGSLRPGVELFARQTNSEPVQVSIGAGLIISFGLLDIRLGAGAGLTEAAPDFSASLWISGKFPVTQSALGS
jgi:hypothetical protein